VARSRAVRQTKQHLGWLPIACFALSIAALVVSAYLAYAHFATSNVLACPEGGTINCELVTTSAQSKFLGIPVAVLGLLWSAAMVALTTPAAWRSRRRRPEIRIARLALVSIGMCFVVWLVYAELFVIGAICLWCTVVHAVTFALFVLLMLDAARAHE
jgi:uncharacterized membrane protein